MNREIKFRGKRVDNGKMVYGDLIHGVNHKMGKMYILPIQGGVMALGHGLDALDGYEVIPETVGQYTGLKDKNGKEIYEGDILKRRGGVSFVVWILDRWRYNSWMPGSMDLYDSVNKTRGGDYEIAEVIGNIHSNPELLQ